MGFKYLLILILFFLTMSCTHNDNNGWQQKNIDIKLHELFPNADSIKFSTTETAEDIDSIHLPTPVYKVFVKEKNAINYDYIFYFYEIYFKDTMFSNLFKQIIIHDLKTGFGTKKADYLLTFPQFDSTNGNNILVFAASLINNRDSAYLDNKQKEISKSFGLTRHQRN